MMSREKTCVIISSYIKNSLDEIMLSLTIESWSRQNYDILLCSHTPISQNIQKAVKYFVYSDNNEILKFKENTGFHVYYQSSDFIYRTNFGNTLGSHSYAIVSNLKNGLQILQEKDYTHFIFIDDDQFLTFSDHSVFAKTLGGYNSSIYKGWFFLPGEKFAVSNLFGGEIKFFHNFFKNIKTPEDYLEYCSSLGMYTLESFLDKFRKENPDKFFTIATHPNEFFKNEWFGASSGGVVSIPGIPRTKTSIDIVRDKNSSDSIFTVLWGEYVDDKLDVIIYNNGEVVVEYVNISASPFLWWKITANEGMWKAVCKINNKVISSVEYSLDKIQNNLPSFFELY